MKHYHIYTIGCQMNVADSGHVAAELEALGYEPTEQEENADVIIINTCVVRQQAEDRAVGKLTSLAPLKAQKPGTVLGLMGCMVGPSASAALRNRFPYVDVFLPPSEPGPLVALLRRRIQGDGDTFQAVDAEMAEIEAAQLAQRWQKQDAAPARSLPGRQHTSLQSVHHLAVNGQAPVAAHVPIVYGCSHACTFCIIPFRRGIERSRPVEEIVSEVRDLVGQGVREVTLLGQIVDRYGWDIAGAPLGPGAIVDKRSGFEPRPDLADLMQRLSEIDDLWRIRFLTSHPSYMSERILRAVANLPKVCEHIEIPIQSGNDEVLAQMRRGYTTAEYRELIARVRNLIPDTAIHTDIIVGFPGETEAQFEDTYNILAELKLDKVHLAMYSPRPGTVSARRMPDDVPAEEKKRRLHALDALQQQVVGEINSRFLGQTVEVLVEDQHKGKWQGRTRLNKIVFFEHPDNWRGQLAKVHITRTGPWSMTGEVVTPVAELMHPMLVEP